MVKSITYFIKRKPVLWNMIIFGIAMLISQTAIEIFNISSTLYILDTTGNVLLSALVQILRYLPTLIAFAIAPIFIKKFNNRKIIFISEIISAVLIFVVFITFFAAPPNPETVGKESVSAVSIAIYIAIVIWNIFNSARFLALKNIVYRLSKIETDINKYNRINNFATSFSFLFGALASLGLAQIISFKWICLIITILYIVSALLYYSFVMFDNIVKISSKPQIKLKSKSFRYTFVILISLALFAAITFVPRFGTNTNFMIALFAETKNSPHVKKWVQIYLIVVALGLCLGSIIIFLLGKKILMTTSIIFVILTLASSIFYLWAFGGFEANLGLAKNLAEEKKNLIIDKSAWAYSNVNTMLWIFLTITFFQYFLFSMFLPVYFDYSYRTVPSQSYAKFAAMAMIIFQLLGVGYTILMVLVFNSYNYQISFFIFAISGIVFVSIAGLFTHLLKRRQIALTKDHQLKPENELL